MNDSSPQKDMPISRNGSYAGGNGHIHTVTSVAAAAAAAQAPTNGHSSPSSLQEDQRPYKKVVRYMECLKNHAASIGGNATDGCGEFIPGGEEGSLGALKCSACNCHRNFHRKEMDGECSYDCHHHYPMISNLGSGRLVLGHHNGIIGSPVPQGYPTSSFISSRAPPPMVVSYKTGGANAITSESDEKEEDNGGGILTTRPVEKRKKRFRTKFTEEQKQKMVNFAEKAGWKMQKLEESLVQGFCEELGIKRRVLKVWMHNNKHNYVKKNSTSS